MNTIKPNNTSEIDYEQLAKEGSPDAAVIRRGTKARRMRREASKQRITIRIDEDLLEEFKTMVPEGRGYQSLINQALREWLVVGGVKGLLRDELTKAFQQVVGSVSAKAS